MNIEIKKHLTDEHRNQIARTEFERMLGQKHSSILVLNFDHDKKQFSAWSNMSRPQWDAFVGAFFKELELATAQQTSGN